MFDREYRGDYAERSAPEYPDRSTVDGPYIRTFQDDYGMPVDSMRGSEHFLLIIEADPRSPTVRDLERERYEWHLHRSRRDLGAVGPGVALLDSLGLGRNPEDIGRALGEMMRAMQRPEQLAPPESVVQAPQNGPTVPTAVPQVATAPAATARVGTPHGPSDVAFTPPPPYVPPVVPDAGTDQAPDLGATSPSSDGETSDPTAKSDADKAAG